MLKKSFAVVTFLSILTVLGLILFASRQTLPQINTSNLIFLEKDYLLEPINNFFSSPAKYELVKITIQPTSFRYFRQYHRELDSIINHPENINIYLNDRISQAFQWGNTLNIHKDIADTAQLITWWKKFKPNFLEFYAGYKFNSWESLLAQYQYLSLYQTDNLLGKKFLDRAQLSSLKSIFLANQRDLLLSVYQVNKTQSEKEYLVKLINDLFSSLYSKFDKYLVKPDASAIQYSTQPMIDDHHYGIYDILIDTENEPASYLNKASLTINNQKVQLSINADKNKGNYIIGQSILNQKTNRISLIFPEVSILDKSGWYQREQTEKNIFRYYYDISHYQPNQSYLISVNFAVTKPILLQMESVFTNNDKTQGSNIVLSETLLPQMNNQMYTYPITFPANTNLNYLHFIATSSTPMSLQELATISLKFQPSWTPTILLNKESNLSSSSPAISYKKIDFFNHEVIVSNTNKDQDEIINKSFTKNWSIINKVELSPTKYQLQLQSTFFSLIKKIVFYYLLFLVMTIIYLKNKFFSQVYFKFSSEISRRLQPIQLLFSNLSSKNILILLAIIYLLIIYDIFVISSSYLMLNLILSIIYYFVNKYAKSKFSLSYLSALSFLFFSFFLLLFKSEVAAGSSAIWALLFLIIGTVEEL